MLELLVLAIILCGVAYGSYWIITHFFPEPIRMFALVVVGIILLFLLLGAVSGYIPGDLLRLPQ
jgi:multisubunit Na+/H+ antiporter MnhB subunit